MIVESIQFTCLIYRRIFFPIIRFSREKLEYLVNNSSFWSLIFRSDGFTRETNPTINCILIAFKLQFYAFKI